jgi:hypothetical protein
MALLAPFCPALAYESFHLSLSAYQGVQLTSGMTEFDPTVLTVIIGDATSIDAVLAPDADPLFEFSPEIDVYFGLSPDADTPVEVVASAIAGIAVLANTGFTEADTRRSLGEIRQQWRDQVPDSDGDIGTGTKRVVGKRTSHCNLAGIIEHP